LNLWRCWELRGFEDGGRESLSPVPSRASSRVSCIAICYLVGSRQSIVHLAKTTGGLANCDCPLAASGREAGTSPEKVAATHPGKRAIQISSLLHHFNRCFQLHMKRLSRAETKPTRPAQRTFARFHSAQQLPPFCYTPSLYWPCMNPARPGKARMSGAVSGVETGRAPCGYKSERGRPSIALVHYRPEIEIEQIASVWPSRSSR
jgi:hypothetical protein